VPSAVQCVARRLQSAANVHIKRPGVEVYAKTLMQRGRRAEGQKKVIVSVADTHYKMGVDNSKNI
jgi:hypothetical protein